MTWHVRFRFDGTDNIARYPTELAAIEAACRLLDDGCRVFGIGPRFRGDTLNKDQIACIHELWAKAKHSPPATLIGRTLCHWPEPSQHPILTPADASFAAQEPAVPHLRARSPESSERFPGKLRNSCSE